MKTIVAITSQNKKTVTKHVGKCLNFLIYTIENEEVTNKRVLELQPNEILKNIIHDDQNLNSNYWIYDVNILLSGSMGSGARDHLAKKNVAAFIVKEKDPDITIEKLIDGTLEAFVPAAAHHNGRGNCNHDHDHDHSHEGGCNHHHNHDHGEGGCHHHQ